MGNTTIIELNHDQASDIFYNDISEKHFLQQIRNQLSAFEYNGKDILGGKVIVGFHRSGRIYDMWISFKQLMKW